MGTEALWLTPLILLPGVGLLVMSTSARYAQIHTEFHHLLAQSREVSMMITSHLVRRAGLFRNAMVALYVSVGLFALASLLGVATSGWRDVSFIVIIGLTSAGIATLLFASIELIRESILSLEIISGHVEQLQNHPGDV